MVVLTKKGIRLELRNLRNHSIFSIFVFKEEGKPFQLSQFININYPEHSVISVTWEDWTGDEQPPGTQIRIDNPRPSTGRKKPVRLSGKS
jgi:hypothetical protein